MIAMESPTSHVLPHQLSSHHSPTPGMTPTGHNPLNLMSKLQKTGTYSSPPPIACHPENNVCKLIEYRGAKIAAFMVDGRELVCLPQAFELFLKHLVGGLHTVYTKLKRLDITPIVCNVEQVRILRGLGAIQPGVNRCKLISCKEFDILYDDCTNSSARPGRPPKRSPSIHASPETIEKLKKSRLDGDYQFDPRLYGDRKTLLNGFPHHPYAMGHLPFMPLTHPIMSPPVSMAMAQHLGLRPDGSIIKERASSESDLMSPRVREDGVGKSPYEVDRGHSRMMDTDPNKPLNLHVNGHVKDSYKAPGPLRSDDDDDEIDDDKMSDDDRDDDLEDSVDISESYHGPGELGDKVGAGQLGHNPPQLINGEAAAAGAGISSIETLLLNIQGLLKVAAENARHYERQSSLEKAELKMELLREKEVREQTEKQLVDEQKKGVILQKRLKKEKKARRRLQEQMESLGTQQGNQTGVHVDTCKQMNSPESTRNNTDSLDQDSDVEKQSQSDSEKKSPELSESRTPTHRDIFEAFPPPNPLNTPRFPYLPLVQNEVQ